MWTVLSGLLAGSFAQQQGYNLPSQDFQINGGYSYNGPDLRAEASDVPVNPLVKLAENIPGGGIPGDDYPILASVPETDFNCEDQETHGYYADISDEARCQVFHICQDGGRKDSFLCPNGTLFQQQYFVCDWWFNVDCSAAQEFFSRNAEIGVVPDDVLDATRIDAAATNQLYTVPQQAPPQDQYSGAQNRFQQADAPVSPADRYGLPSSAFNGAPAPPRAAPAERYGLPSSSTNGGVLVPPRSAPAPPPSNSYTAPRRN